MKRLIKFILFLIMAVVVLAIAAPFFIPLDEVKKLASEKVKEMTGRDLIVAGDVSASVFPNIAVSLQKVSFSNPDGFSSKQMAEIGELKAEIALMPLLQGNVEIKQIVITKPIIHLEINKDKVANWQINMPEKSADDSKNTGEKKNVSAIPVLGNTQIIDGEFSYKDQTTGKSYSVKNIDLDIKFASMNSPIDVVAGFVLNGQKIKLKLYAKKPMQIISGGESDIKFDAKIGELAAIVFDGKASMKNASGELDFSTPSLISLSELSGKKMQWSGSGELAFSLKTSASCSISECSFSKANIALDDNKLAGDLKVAFAGEKPNITANFSSEQLDLNPLLPNNKKQALFTPEIKKFADLIIADAMAAQDWSNEKIDFSGLKAANANISINAKTVLYQITKLEDLALKLKLAGGALAIDIPHVSLYSGTAKISATANSANAISANITAENIKLEPFLKDFANFDRLSGTAKFSTAISGHGATQQEIISSLSGNGNINVADGVIRGVDIAKLVGNAKELVTGANTSSQTTNFSEMSGTFTIASGVVSNNDLAIKSPMLRVRGAGTASLPTKHVNYRIIPSIVSNAQGQGGNDKTGFEIPFIVDGDFDSLKFHPDLAGMAQDAINDPEKLKKNLKNAKESIKDIKGALKDPKNIDNLLKGLGR